ncbi:lipid A biosynthesis acyltransferase [Halorhodospira abdelmalekii]|uniref:LpxL/LpxP family acyltransferase n=1 Tax=Halorhodospira abdelmalekii TaxID=421629 RepID=UPI0019050DF2|nr:lipid A biosynthesis acyltransferase [Halorhodospira abdelmalekii]
MRRFGRRRARLLLYPITLYFFITSPTARAEARRFLQRVHGPQAVSQRLVFENFFAFAAVIFDRVYFQSGDIDCFDIRIHDEDGATELALSQGAIIIGAHFGSFDAARCMAVGHKNVQLKIVMQAEQNRGIHQVLESLNPDFVSPIIPMGGSDTLLEVKEWLERGGCVGMLGDRVGSRRRSCECEFLGAPARFPLGPWRIAYLLQVPVILFFGVYRGKDRYDIYLEKAGVPSSAQDEETELCRWVQYYVERLERYVVDAPLNWFNFYDFWSDAQTQERSTRRDPPLATDSER